MSEISLYLHDLYGGNSPTRSRDSDFFRVHVPEVKNVHDTRTGARSYLSSDANNTAGCTFLT